jgi:rubrerythrin
MIGLLRKLAIGTLLRVRWRAEPHRLARTLGKFADVEADSAWHYSVAADLLRQPAHRAEMVLTALEEVHHAYLFDRLATRHGTVEKRSISRKRLISSADDLPGFLAYARIAEATIHNEFNALAEASGDEEARAAIQAISCDESAHEEDALTLLHQLTTEASFRSALRRARLKRVYDDWMEVVRSIGTANAFVWLSAIYLILGWIGRASCQQRLDQGRAPDVGQAAWATDPSAPLPRGAEVAS